MLSLTAASKDMVAISPAALNRGVAHFQTGFLPTTTKKSMQQQATSWVPVLSIRNSGAGEIKREVLSGEGRTKLNPRPDKEFYSFPRFVTHVDDGFLESLTATYRERIRAGSDVLDLMSSWVSHLPLEVEYKRVVGHGLNAEELAANKRLLRFFVQDLNTEPILPLESDSFDAVLCAVSVQYLEQPEKVFAEVFRVLQPGGVFIVSFSNRMFYEKAVGAWRDASDYAHTQLVVEYFECVAGFTEPEVLKGTVGKKQNESSSSLDWAQMLMGGLYSDPFYAVLSYKNFKPVFD